MRSSRGPTDCIWEGRRHHQKIGPGDPDRNLRIYEKQLALGKILSPREQFYYGRELYAHGKFQEAAEIFQNFLDGGRGG